MVDTAIILHPFLKDKSVKDDAKYKLEEANNLSSALENLDIVHSSLVPLSKIIPATYIGIGKIEEIKEKLNEKDISLLIINTAISPVQQRNLEEKLKIKVIDRTALILEIFAKRAQTKEGRLQVDLAMQEYQKSRLVRSWTHLERQRGGAGFMGGPGERQIESDRRMINDRINIIKKQLEKVVKRRGLHRSARKKVPYPVVSLAGYTNAGKSTLFNLLTKADVFAKDLLFATLDTTMRLLILPSGRKVILSDTVGFISDLPTQLVAAFRATLEEITEADLILHVIDISSDFSQEQKQDVNKILIELVGEEKLESNVIEVQNKYDICDEERKLFLSETSSNVKVPISAKEQFNIDNLLNAIDYFFAGFENIINIKVPVINGKVISWLHENTEIINSQIIEEYLTLECKINEKNLGRLKQFTDIIYL